jgi:hypothetical protein
MMRAVHFWPTTRSAEAMQPILGSMGVDCVRFAMLISLQYSRP